MAKKVSHHYRVYVIEVLHPDGHPVLYVGQSSLSPLERLRQHVRGKRYCGPCRKRTYIKGPEGSRFRLRQDLLPRSLKVVYLIRKEAEAAERQAARWLRAQGYHVAGGH